MIKIFNADNSTYLYLKDYLEALELVLEAEDEEELDEFTAAYRLVYMYLKSNLFTEVKRRTALRGKYLRDDKGKPMIDKVAMTNDEKSIFSDYVYDAAVQVFNRLSGYARGIEDAFRLSQSVTVTMTGTSGSAYVTIRNTEYYATHVTDLPTTCANFITANAAALLGEGIICTHPTGTATLIFATEEPDRPLHDDLDFINIPITGNLAGTGADVVEYIIFHFNLDEYLDTNLAEILDKTIERAFIHYVIKEWYEDIGSPDAVMEDRKYQIAYAEILSRSHKLNTNVKRPTPLF